MEETYKSLLYTSAMVGSVTLGVIISSDINIILGVLVSVICICSIFYDFFKSNNF